MGIQGTREDEGVDPDVIAAFFSGIAAVLSAYVSLRLSRRRFERECAQRIEEVRRALREGFELGRG
jgi:hypothetical protein